MFDCPILKIKHQSEYVFLDLILFPIYSVLLFNRVCRKLCWRLTSRESLEADWSENYRLSTVENASIIRDLRVTEDRVFFTKSKHVMVAEREDFIR